MTRAELRPAPWMCFRTWRSASGDVLALLGNERDHEIATLDGASAELWSKIEDGTTREDLAAKAASLGVEDEIDDFVAMLQERGFLLEGTVDTTAMRATDAPVPRSLEEAENTTAEHDVMAWVARNGFLFAVHWEVTYRCNERCAHCYNPGAAHAPHERPDRETDELSTSEALSLLDDMKAAGVFRLTLSGGEVMLRKDFWQLLAAARARGFSVNLYTNALKLDEEACRRLAALWPSTVSVSIYSAEASAHDAITAVPGSFDRSVRALERLRATGIRTFLKSTQMTHTLTGYALVRDLAARVGAGAEIDMMMSAAVDGADAPVALAARCPEELVVLAATQGSPLFVGDATSGYGRLERDPLASVCGAGVGALGIDPTGGINTCNSMPILAGSHRTHGFLAIWQASRQHRRAHGGEPPPNTIADAVAPLSRWQSIRLADFRECGTHRRCGWCTKCPGLAMLEHGDPLAPSTTNCRLATARMTAADLLAQGMSRDAIATRLGVPLDFGRRKARVLPVLQENVRGTGFDPQAAAASAMSDCGAGAIHTDASYRDRAGVTQLHRGTAATRAALADFDALTSRLAEGQG